MACNLYKVNKYLSIIKKKKHQELRIQRALAIKTKIMN